MAEHMHSETAPGAEAFSAPATEHGKGFVASAARTIGADVERVYAAWSEGQRAEWLRGDQLVVTDQTPGVSLHAAWGAGRLRVLFMPRGAARAYVTLDHEGLPTARRAEQMTKFWRARLSRLAALVERTRR